MPRRSISSRVEERAEGEDARRRVTTRHGDQRRADQFLAVTLDQPVDSVGEQRRGGVGVAVPREIVVRVLQAKIGAEVDDVDAAIEELRHELLAVPVGQRDEDHVNVAGEDVVRAAQRPVVG